MLRTARQRFRTFQVCLKDGFGEGRDVAIEYRWAEDQYDRSVVDWNLILSREELEHEDLVVEFKDVTGKNGNGHATNGHD
jgi:hypothetical protein